MKKINLTDHIGCLITIYLIIVSIVVFWVDDIFLKDFLGNSLYYIMMGIVYILGALMLYAVIVLLSSLFWKGEVGKEMRKSCLAHIIVMFGPALVVLGGMYIYNNCKGNGFHDDKTQILVYICTGPNSKAYHQKPDCKGLQKCSENVIQIDVKEALDRGRHACKYCCD